MNRIKTCTMCGMEKPVTEFPKRSRAKDGLSHWCKACYKKWAAEYYLKNKERLQAQHQRYRLSHLEDTRRKSREYYYSEEGNRKRREYEDKNKDKIATYRKEYYERNKESIKSRTAEYQKNNKDKVHGWHKTYREKHAKQLAQQQKEYRESNREAIAERRSKRLHDDPVFKKAEQVRNNIRDAFRSENHRKKSKTAEIVGCDLYTFKKHLLNTWKEQYGREWQGEPYQFHHIIPLSTAKTEADVLRLNHYTNIRLISPSDHLKEHHKKQRL